MKKIPEFEILLEKISLDLQDFLQKEKIDDAKFIGIRSGGVWVAKALREKLASSWDLGILDISFYRDDYSMIGLNPEVKGSEISFSCEDENIILVDDILMTGRTIRAALNQIFDFGRPKRVVLVSVLKIDARQLPIQPDIYAAKINLEAGRKIKLLQNPLRFEWLNLENKNS